MLVFAGGVSVNVSVNVSVSRAAQAAVSHCSAFLPAAQWVQLPELPVLFPVMTQGLSPGMF